jgi:putative ABC transport system ATP-binding protein
MSSLISLNNVSKVYSMRGGDVHALKSITLEIGQGEFVSVVGTSGSGKSTLLYVLGTLIETTSGTYKLDGKQVDTLTDIQRAHLRGQGIGFVFQSFHLVPQLNIVSNVLLSGRYVPGIHRGQLKKRAHDLIERVGLGHRKRHRPIELSNGEMQRVAIARALLMEPDVVLADEPTGNLDQQNCDDIFELLRSLHEDGKTIVMVTHDLDLAARTPRQIRLSDGEVVHEAA